MKQIKGVLVGAAGAAPSLAHPGLHSALPGNLPRALRPLRRYLENPVGGGKGEKEGYRGVSLAKVTAELMLEGLRAR